MAEGLPKVRAKHSYKAQTEQELSFEKGDVLTILEMRDDDWYGDNQFVVHFLAGCGLCLTCAR